jgi:adenylate cyclase
MSLISELKRRKVVRVAVVYAATAFVVLQAADLILPALLLPEWTSRMLVLVSLVGFPVALALAWALELTPDGVRVTPRAASEPAPAAPALLGRRTALVAGALVLAGVTFGAGWVLGPDSRTGLAQRPAPAVVSVAVLPFADLSADRSQEYFGDGIAEELLNTLRAADVAVASRTSSFAFKGSNHSLREIAQQLGVNHVVDGSVRKAGNRVRISAQVVDAVTDRPLWAQTFERELDDIFRIQDEIATAVASALRVRLASDERPAAGTADAEAYDLYLLGLYHWNQRTPDGVRRAIEIFTAATERDPTFARAWAGLGFAYYVRPEYDDYDQDEAQRRARDVAERAVRLDPRSAEARTALGAAIHLAGDIDAALREYERAIELDPNFPTAHHWRGILLTGKGELAASEASLRQARRLDPAAGHGHHGRPVPAVDGPRLRQGATHPGDGSVGAGAGEADRFFAGDPPLVIHQPPSG